MESPTVKDMGHNDRASQDIKEMSMKRGDFHVVYTVYTKYHPWTLLTETPARPSK